MCACCVHIECKLCVCWCGARVGVCTCALVCVRAVIVLRAAWLGVCVPGPVDAVQLAAVPVLIGSGCGGPYRPERLHPRDALRRPYALLGPQQPLVHDLGADQPGAQARVPPVEPEQNLSHAVSEPRCCSLLCCSPVATTRVRSCAHTSTHYRCVVCFTYILVCWRLC